MPIGITGVFGDDLTVKGLRASGIARLQDLAGPNIQGGFDGIVGLLAVVECALQLRQILARAWPKKRRDTG
jgi:hypothetical protein